MGGISSSFPPRWTWAGRREAPGQGLQQDPGQGLQQDPGRRVHHRQDLPSPRNYYQHHKLKQVMWRMNFSFALVNPS